MKENPPLQGKDVSLFIVILTLPLVLFPQHAVATTVSVDCSGSTAGAFTTIQAAIDSLDVVGPHEIDVLTGPCNENILITNRQRLTITAPSGVSINSKTGDNVVTIQGSTAIQLANLNFAGGQSGIVIGRNSEVSVLSCTSTGNAGQGVDIQQNSTVLLDSVITSGNGFNGVRGEDSSLTIQGSTLENNGFRGLTLRRAHATLKGFNGATVVQGNREGVGLLDGGAIVLNAPNFIQNNKTIGFEVAAGSSAILQGDVDSNGNPIPNVITGNSGIGLNSFAGQTYILGAAQITNNGFGNQPFHAGVRVDDNSSFLATGEGDINISNNTGPGIAVTAGGTLDLIGVVINHNSEDGINLVGNSQVAFSPPNSNVIIGNEDAAIACDRTSVFVGDPTGVSKLACRITPLNPQYDARIRLQWMRAEHADRPANFGHK
jgi:hypothetical protein